MQEHWLSTHREYLDLKLAPKCSYARLSTDLQTPSSSSASACMNISLNSNNIKGLELRLQILSPNIGAFDLNPFFSLNKHT
mmetsp:Transcript_28249/g.50435  ORF Transcript_28249/g.50435 Transcript_28249/m.50435 type:complete len:81 (-) Transcript_28249:925-1167(-)